MHGDFWQQMDGGTEQKITIALSSDKAERPAQDWRKNIEMQQFIKEQKKDNNRTDKEINWFKLYSDYYLEVDNFSQQGRGVTN